MVPDGGTGVGGWWAKAMNSPEKPRAAGRLVPDIPFPPYTFVPGVTPHPCSDPAGHSFGKPPELPDPIDPQRWWECRPYLYGIDLFNGPAPPLPGASARTPLPAMPAPGFGYYWEAHEVWEGLWHAAGRQGTTADFLKGLIKLAAAGVKFRQGVARAVRGHAARAKDLFRGVARDLGGEDARFLGLRLADLLTGTHVVESMAERAPGDREENVVVAFPVLLRPAFGVR
jgi:hypothetical protein